MDTETLVNLVRSNPEAKRALGIRENFRDKLLFDLCNLHEAHYGGAFDIGDDQYFTREDIDEAAEEVVEKITEKTNKKFDTNGNWLEDNTWTVRIISPEEDEFEDSVNIDMRKIRNPSDLKGKYAEALASKLINQIKDFEREL